MVKLVVGNLPPSATNQSLKEIFHQYEDLQDYKLISNYGFVYLESEMSANHAVTHLNGLDYRGFEVTVDYVGDSRQKRRLPPQPLTASQQPAAFSKQPSAATAPASASAASANHSMFSVPSNMEQRNTNPYNIDYQGETNGINQRSYSDVPPIDRRRMMMNDARNNNPYNLPSFATHSNSNINNNGAHKRQLEAMGDHRYGVQPGYAGSQPDYGNPMMPLGAYGGLYSADNYYEDHYGEEDPYYYGGSGGGVAEDDYLYYNNSSSYPPPMKRMRSAAQIMDNDGYGYGRSGRPAPAVDYSGEEDEFRAYRVPHQPQYQQPSWYEARQMAPRPTFLHSEDEPYYHPRGKRIYTPKKSYIDEYEDDRDYGDIDPYPAYLKQYKK